MSLKKEVEEGFTRWKDLQCSWIGRSNIVKIVLKNKRTSGEIIIPDLKLYYREIVIKITWYCHIDTQVDQWNRIEDPEMEPHTYGHLIFNKEPKNVQGEK